MRKRLGICCIVPPLALLSAWGDLSAATLTVRPDGVGFYPNLQAAIDAAAVGDTVLALPGTYSGPGNRQLDFRGKDIALIGRDGSAETIIDCEYSGRGVLFVSGETRAALLAGFRIVHGGGGDRLTSGGVRCEYSSPTLRNLWISGSNVTAYGGVGAL